MLAHLRTIALGTLVLLSLSLVHGVAASLKARPIAAAPPQQLQSVQVKSLAGASMRAVASF